MAVNNNIGEEGKEAEEKVQSHIFVWKKNFFIYHR